MNPVLRNSNVIGKIIKKSITIKSGGIKYIPCNSKCICLMYLDMNELRSQNYYQNCFHKKTKNT